MLSSNLQNIHYLFEYFNSDKGENFTNQYVQPSKKTNKIIKAHGYAKIYEKYSDPCPWAKN